MNLRSFASLTALALLVGCSSSGGNNNTNTEADTSVDEDTGGGGEDTGGGEDSSTVDSSKPDTSVSTDSGSDETAVSDGGSDSPADAAEVSTKCSKAGDIETGDCGKCGTRARLCDSTGVWLPWGACTGEKGVCVAGDTRTTACGKCGKRSETCSTTCGWEPGACSGEGICNSGDVEVQYGACSNPKYVKTRTCTTTCGWGDWSACVPPKGWNDIATTTASGRQYHTAVWSGTEMLVWGGYNGSYLSDGFAYNVSTDTWRTLPAVTSTITTFVGRQYHTSVWTGSKMIVWGGYSPSYRNDGAAYDPSTNSWATIATAPITGRYSQSAVWTGTELIVWGGYNGSYLSDGAAYNPSTNTWRTLATAPISGRYLHTAVWTGDKMVVYGGYGSSCASSYCGDAAAYDPVANTWTPLSPPSTDLDGRYYHSGLLAGDSTKPLAVFWGGYGSYVASSYYRNSGGIFDVSTGTWKAMTVPSDTLFPTSKRYYMAAWSTGDTVYYWGGSGSSSYLANGASYELATGTWKAMSDTNAPTGRQFATAVWTGAEAIVWGGYSSLGYRNDGKIYRP